MRKSLLFTSLCLSTILSAQVAPWTGVTLAQGTAGAPTLNFSGDARTGIYSSGAGTLNFSTGGTNALTIQSNGDLTLNSGLNVMNPYVHIQLHGAPFLHDDGVANLGVGFLALAVTSGTGNTASGYWALKSNTNGSNNTANGTTALSSNTTGSHNIALGSGAGYYITTTSNNIDIGSEGVAGDSGVIRIGTGGTQTSFLAAGIAGVSVSNQAQVMINTSTGQLGSISSSRRYKEDIQDMSDASSGLLKLRPVTFRYQQPYPDGSQPLDYGLIAEEVAQVYPGLVARGPDGQIETVQYHKLIPMLLNEVQKLEKEHGAMEVLRDQLAALQKEHAQLQKALAAWMSEKVPPATPALP